MDQLRRFVIFLLLFALLSGCATFVQAPRVAIKGTNLVGLDASGIDIEFNLGITNPNRFDLSLLSYTYDLQVMTLPFSSGRTQLTVFFPSGKETDVLLPLHLTFDKLLTILKQHPDLSKLPYQINALLQLKTPFGEMHIPVREDDTLIIPERYLPGAAINRLRDALSGIR